MRFRDGQLVRVIGHPIEGPWTQPFMSMWGNMPAERPKIGIIIGECGAVPDAADDAFAFTKIRWYRVFVDGKEGMYNNVDLEEIDSFRGDT